MRSRRKGAISGGRRRGYRRGIFLHLRRGDLGLHDNAASIQLYGWTATRFDASIAFRRWVEIIRVRESILRPREPARAILYRVEDHLSVFDAWQVEVLCEIVEQLLHADVIPTPQRYLVNLETQDRSGHADDQQTVVFQFLR